MLGAAYNEAKSHGTAEKGQVFGCFLVWRVQESETSGTSTHTDMQYNPNATKLFPSYLHSSPHAMEPNGLQIFFNPRINQSVLGMTQVPCPKHHPPVLSKNQCYHLNILLSKYLEKLSKMIERGFFLMQGDHRSGPHPGHQPHCPGHPSARLSTGWGQQNTARSTVSSPEIMENSKVLWRNLIPLRNTTQAFPTELNGVSLQVCV